MVTGVGRGDSANDPLAVGAGVDLPPPLGGDDLGGEVFAGEDFVVLGFEPFEVGEFGLGVFVDVVPDVVDGSGVPVVVVPVGVPVVDVVPGVGAVLLVGEPVPEGLPPGWVVFGPLAVGTAVVGSAVGAPGAVASTPTQ